MQLARSTGQISGTCCRSQRQYVPFTCSSQPQGHGINIGRACVVPDKHAGAVYSRPQRFPQRGQSGICRATVPTAEPGKTALGFCGIGIMGLPMVRGGQGKYDSGLLQLWCVSICP